MTFDERRRRAQRPFDRPPRRVRIVVSVLALIATGATYAATKSEEVQVIALIAVVFGGTSFTRFWIRDEHLALTHGLNMPTGMLALSFVLWAPWAALVLFVLPEARLGPWFYGWLALAPWLEVVTFLGERDVRLGGVEAWKPQRPLRDCGGTAVATALAIFAISLLQGEGLRDAFAVGLGCGGVTFVMVGAALWFSRGRRPPPPAA